jgi:hypothetical protein
VCVTLSQTHVFPSTCDRVRSSALQFISHSWEAGRVEGAEVVSSATLSCESICALHAPRSVRSFPDAGLQDFENDGSQFRSSAVLASCDAIGWSRAKLRSTLHSRFRVQKSPTSPGPRGLHPQRALHTERCSHISKFSELFETLPCESGAMISTEQVGRIDFATCTAIGFVFSTLECGDRSDRGRSILAPCAYRLNLPSASCINRSMISHVYGFLLWLLLSFLRFVLRLPRIDAFLPSRLRHHLRRSRRN